MAKAPYRGVMFKRIQRILQAIESNWALAQLLGSTAIVGVVVGFLSALTDLMNQYGPVSWAFAGLFAACLWAFANILLAEARFRRIKAKAVDKWSKEEFDSVNPLESEFIKKRININAFSDPVEKAIQGKRFVDCDLNGPAVILLENKLSFSHTHWVDCQFVVLAPRIHNTQNFVTFRDCEFRGGRLANCLVLVYETMLPYLDFIGKESYLSITPGELFLSQQHSNIEPKTPR